ncbi:MAG: methionyl-tRNA formyltransferase [Bacteroidetes bacterium]|jgi:methionyl-tRNA formyltransferase|nr:methionyl-tRNA formyltransferase [Bacteroidota bacterium]
MKIVFMGTPDFAVPCLDILVKNNYDIAGVVTMPDKPAGRGQQLQQSPVKKYALEHHLKVLQPEKLKAPEFIEELKSLQADLQIVVAFRMLPEAVWDMPALGTYNLHASLLPNYRGAAPINWALINGEKETGVTTFKLQHEIDTGSILFSEKVALTENTTAGELHDTLMNIGAELMLKTVKAIESGNYKAVPQIDSGANKHAPKLFKESCKIDWNKDVESVHNLIRGLSPYPAAWTEGKDSKGMLHSVKVYTSSKEIATHIYIPGSVHSDGKTYLKVACSNGFVYIHELQLAGKKRLKTEELLRGFKFEEGFVFQ